MSASKRSLDLEKVAGAIAETLRRDFQGIEIVDVHVAEDVDQYGDDMLRVMVVFEGKLQGDDLLRVARAPRRLDPLLEEIGTELFPLLDFVSKADYNRGRRRSARH